MYIVSLSFAVLLANDFGECLDYACGTYVPDEAPWCKLPCCCTSTYCLIALSHVVCLSSRSLGPVGAVSLRSEIRVCLAVNRRGFTIHNFQLGRSARWACLTNLCRRYKLRRACEDSAILQQGVRPPGQGTLPWTWLWV